MIFNITVAADDGLAYFNINDHQIKLAKRGAKTYSMPYKILTEGMSFYDDWWDFYHEELILTVRFNAEDLDGDAIEEVLKVRVVPRP
ncbi:hypothetical protein LV85_04172 [Algoriphagus chordae]|uniref:Uncharacterized protein n=2 Tax=Algoriphagus chordae TaxID=237019 RepID=A0A2W7QEA1_9BACT|nr:hypothetical protein LV85_04172 [Algoriphagus chordae]